MKKALLIGVLLSTMTTVHSMTFGSGPFNPDSQLATKAKTFRYEGEGERILRDQARLSTVIIHNQTIGIGTGFFYRPNDYPEYLVTAHHVINNGVNFSIGFHLAALNEHGEHDFIQSEKYTFVNFPATDLQWNKHPQHDLAILEFKPLKTKIETLISSQIANSRLFYHSITESDKSEDNHEVLLAGYGENKYDQRNYLAAVTDGTVRSNDFLPGTLISSVEGPGFSGGPLVLKGFQSPILKGIHIQGGTNRPVIGTITAANGQPIIGPLFDYIVQVYNGIGTQIKAEVLDDYIRTLQPGYQKTLLVAGDSIIIQNLRDVNREPREDDKIADVIRKLKQQEEIPNPSQYTSWIIRNSHFQYADYLQALLPLENPVTPFKGIQTITFDTVTFGERALEFFTKKANPSNKFQKHQWLFSNIDQATRDALQNSGNFTSVQFN